MTQRAHSVSALVHYVKQKLDSDHNIRNIIVEGEISNFSYARSGHWYFSIKDENAQIQCAMFSSYNQKVQFEPKNGDKVLVRGSVSVYPNRGELQMVVNGMRPQGVGELYLKYVALRDKLAKEGIFDEAHKKKMPAYPFSIGLITGKDSAARADVVSTLEKRWPIASVTEYHVLVQGDQSAAQIVQALLTADQNHHDVIIMARGGGQMEDLMSFNDEAVAYTVYNLQTPIVTGVGHEVDFTLAEFAADYRAPTPTGAAVYATPNITDVATQIYSHQQRLITIVTGRLQNVRQRFDRLANTPKLRTPNEIIKDPSHRLQTASMRLSHFQKSFVQGKENDLKQLELKLIQCSKEQIRNAENHLGLIEQQLHYRIDKTSLAYRNRISVVQNTLYRYQPEYRLAEEKNRLLQLKQKMSYEAEKSLSLHRNLLERQIDLMDAYSPLKVLKRGFSITSSQGHVIRQINDVQIGDPLSIRLDDGMLYATVEDIKKEVDHHE